MLGYLNAYTCQCTVITKRTVARRPTFNEKATTLSHNQHTRTNTDKDKQQQQERIKINI